MSTRWARRQLKQSQRREVLRLGAFALFGIAFGVAAFLALETESDTVQAHAVSQR